MRPIVLVLLVPPVAGCAPAATSHGTTSRVPVFVPPVHARVETASRAAFVHDPSETRGIELVLDPPLTTLVCELRVHVASAPASSSGRRLRTYEHDVEGCGRATVRARLVNRTRETVTVSEASVTVSRASRSVGGFGYWLDWVLAPGEARALDMPVREAGVLTVAFRAEGMGEIARRSATVERVEVEVER